jgi:hypothetical protein
MASTYLDPSLLVADPEKFAASLYEEDYGSAPDLAASQDDEDDIEEEMDELEGGIFNPHRTEEEWKELVQRIPQPTALGLKGAYQLEKQDAKHRMGDLLDECLKAYKTAGSPPPSFFDWLDAMSDLKRTMLIANHGLIKTGQSTDTLDSRSNIKPSMVKAFMKGVAYLDKAGRKSHRVRFVGGTGMQDGLALDTLHLQTVFSGRGFGIWVMNEKGKMYVGSHVKGLMHHSSFLEGGNVMCGGEIMAAMGKILFLTAKTGHYQAQLENLKYALNVLEVSVDNFSEIKVLVWEMGQPKILTPKQVQVGGYYSAWGGLTKDQGAWLRNREFSKFPSS